MLRTGRTLFAWLLVFLLWNYVGNVALPATHAADSTRTSIGVGSNYRPEQQPDMFNAEVNGIFMMQSGLRTQRAHSNEELLSIGRIINLLNTRIGLLSHDREKVVCRHPQHFARFACEYYVFRLRHILI